MQTKWLDKSFFPALAFILVITLFRVVWLSYVGIPLYADEAQYWYWSLEPAFGYYSKPPMVAWVIAASSSFLGDSEFAVRFFAPVLHGITAILVYLLTSEIFADRRSAFWASVTYITLPSVFLSSLIISTDVPLLLVMSLALYLLYQVQDSKSFIGWAILGVVCGIGLLTKYHFAIFALAALIYLKWTYKLNTTLKNPAIYLGVIAAFIVFLPNIIWNYHNHFVSIGHTSELAGFGSSWNLPLNRVGKFILDQAIMFGPILFVCFIYTLKTLSKTKLHKESKFLLSFGLSYLLIVGLVCILNKSYANWTAPAYVPLLILVTHTMVIKNSKWLRINLAVQVILGVLFLLSPFVVEKLELENSKYDPFRRMRGYDQLSQELDVIRAQYPADAYDFATDDRKTYAWLVYYTNPHMLELKRLVDGDYVPDHFAMKALYVASPKPLLTVSKSINCSLAYNGTIFTGEKVSEIGTTSRNRYHICLFKALL